MIKQCCLECTIALDAAQSAAEEELAVNGAGLAW